ncbi:phosphoribosylaminoimidazolesuccinocarboxamide synthase [Pampinifervens florentissimum]|uniref:phosphoribosylaminoimidazolesuccinocarboxamide synthase n=1 Tax=Pampinifervens florentissimum TaxID=1632019 RepID=UPI0013B49E88|nr:phosphoribosylaminoimidazolesuccinocarboxamide synthase [Hydrogenobacter sp. T-8]QID33773.1 phosphoribosylaminoimidazolesuccinocarboxamide synthase [Hydrogenobacter sp. T-8]
MKLLYEGKAKKVYEVDKEKCLIYFKDTATAFDATKKAEVEGKGVLNNTISSLMFKLLEEKGVKTHFIERVSEREMLVWKAERFDLEVVVRNITAGSICKRLGFKEGEKLEKPLLEFFYKNDQLHDPLICVEHAILLRIADKKTLKDIVKIALKVNTILKKFFKSHGLLLVDFKLEFGRLPDGALAVIDEISPDTCRLWDAKTGEKLDKDRFRFDLGDLLEGYKKVLQKVQYG